MADMACGCDCHYLGGDLEPDTMPSGCGRCSLAHPVAPRVFRGEHVACGCACHAPRERGEVALGAPCGFCREVHDADPVHPDIMTLVRHPFPDPDPEPEEPTMTDITTTTIVDEPVFAGPATLVVDNITYTARTADDVAKLIRRANTQPLTRPFVQKAKGGEGTGSLGLYVEAVTHAANGQPFTHMRFFVVDNHLYAYNRSLGDSRANWRQRTAVSLQAALNTVQSAINRPSVKVFGHPVLVELTADDLSAIEASEMPPARFRGQYRIEKDYGRYDFKMNVVSSPLPTSLVQALRGPRFMADTPETS